MNTKIIQVVTFDLPEENLQAAEFEKHNPDWIKQFVNRHLVSYRTELSRGVAFGHDGCRKNT